MTAAAVPAETGRWLSALSPRPSRAEAADALMLTALTVIGIIGFRTAYGGHDYLIVGAAGAVLGVVLGHAGHRVHLPLLAVTSVSVLLFLLIGGIVAEAGLGSQVPSLTAMHAVVSASIHGWKQLLTTARPVGTTAHLLVLPYLLGLFSGVAGHALASRTTRSLLPAAAPAAVVVLSILFGADHATAAVLQGAAFAGLALAWAALRQQATASQVTTIGRQQPWYRVGAALAVLAVAVAGATVVGPRLPGAGDHPRVVLHVIPPVNVSTYPSPLAAFRDFTKDSAASVSLYGKRLLSTAGLPAGYLVRIATMDSYNGFVWGVANAAAGTSSFSGFQRIGAIVPGASGHPARTVTITVDRAYQLPWLPDLPGTTGFAFIGPGGRAVANALRFNVATLTGFVRQGLPPGLSYAVTATSPLRLTAAQLADATPYSTPEPFSQTPAVIQAFAQAHSAQASSPVAKVLALASYLKDNGHYSDGSGQADVLAGQSAGRLTGFLQSPQIVGDDEQYAAAMALLSIVAGVPARVALDGPVERNGGVYGRDVRADVELHLSQYGWVTLPASEFTGTKPVTPQPQTTPHPAPAKVVPPPVGNSAPVASENESNAVSRKVPVKPKPAGFRLPALVTVLLRDAGLPVLALAAIAGAMIWAKALRRRRRRNHGPAASRVTGAWRELLDLSRDLGITPPARATRREQAADAEIHGLAGVTALAFAVDAAVFGRADPDEAAAAAIWGLADQTMRGGTAGLTRWRRAWVAVTPASFLATRRNVRDLPAPRAAAAVPSGSRAPLPAAGGGR